MNLCSQINDELSEAVELEPDEWFEKLSSDFKKEGFYYGMNRNLDQKTNVLSLQLNGNALEHKLYAKETKSDDDDDYGMVSDYTIEPKEIEKVYPKIKKVLKKLGVTKGVKFEVFTVGGFSPEFGIIVDIPLNTSQKLYYKKMRR